MHKSLLQGNHKRKKFKETKTWISIIQFIFDQKAFKDAFASRALPSLHKGLLELRLQSLQVEQGLDLDHAVETLNESYVY